MFIHDQYYIFVFGIEYPRVSVPLFPSHVVLSIYVAIIIKFTTVNNFLLL
jgi:hypothetical protein